MLYRLGKGRGGVETKPTELARQLVFEPVIKTIETDRRKIHALM